MNSLSIDSTFLYLLKKLNNLQVFEIYGYMELNEFFIFPSSFLLLLDGGSGMGKNLDPGSATLIKYTVTSAKVRIRIQ
jgi:hypothetical protein